MLEADLRALAAAVAEVLTLRRQLEALEATLAPVVRAWAVQGTPESSPEPVGSPIAANGASPSDPLPGEPQATATEPAKKSCPGCDASFVPKNDRQRFCTRPCGQRYWGAQRKAARKVPGRARKRSGTGTSPEASAPAGGPAAAERRASSNGPRAAADLAPLPDDRPFSETRWREDTSPDLEALKPPPLPWESDARAG